MRTALSIASAALVLFVLGPTSIRAADEPAAPTAPAEPAAVAKTNAAAPAEQGPGAAAMQPSQRARPMRMSAEFIEEVMRARSEMAAVEQQISERKAELYRTDERVRKMQDQMRDLQRQINAILATDKTLAELNLKKDTLYTLAPQMPPAPPALMPQAPQPMPPAPAAPANPPGAADKVTGK